MSYRIGSLQDFYQWVKTRNPAETYDYYSIPDCAVARYARSRGLSYRPNVAGDSQFLGEHIETLLEEAAQQNHLHGYTLRPVDAATLTMGNLRKEIEEYFL